MVDTTDQAPSAKKARTSDTSVDVHSQEATAPAEQQTAEAAAPSQQKAAQDLFGAVEPVDIRSAGGSGQHALLLVSRCGAAGASWGQDR